MEVVKLNNLVHGNQMKKQKKQSLTSISTVVKMVIFTYKTIVSFLLLLSPFPLTSLPCF